MNRLLGAVALTLMITILCCKREPKVPPTLLVVLPDSGQVGDPVTLKGTIFGELTAVKFGNIPSIIQYISDTEIRTVVPSNLPSGLVTITVENADGKSGGVSFRVVSAPPIVEVLKPKVIKTVPAITFAGYPILIYGENLSNLQKVLIDGNECQIFTKNDKVVTVLVPAAITTGQHNVDVTTTGGMSTITLQTLSNPGGGPFGANFTVFNQPPPSYVPSISNRWSCGFFSGDNTSFHDIDMLVENSVGLYDTLLKGRYEYSYDTSKSAKHVNYVEFIVYDTINGSLPDTVAGMFSATSDKSCILKMVLISSRTKEVSVCTFDRRVQDPDVECQP